MRSANFLRLALGIVVGAGVLVLVNLWGEIPAGIGPCPDDPPGEISHCVLGPSPLIVVLKLLVSFLAAVGAAVLAAKTSPKLRIVAGATAATVIAMVWLAARQTIEAQVFDLEYRSRLEAVAIVGGLSFLLGALVAWGTQRWWPNKSLERTRDR
jgi:hypothetical protein